MCPEDHSDDLKQIQCKASLFLCNSWSSLGVPEAGRYYSEYSLQSRGEVKSVSEHLGFSAFYLDCSLGSLKGHLQL